MIGVRSKIVKLGDLLLVAPPASEINMVFGSEEDGQICAAGGYLEAYELLKRQKMRLPSNLEIDRYMQHQIEDSTEENIMFWSREILAYPEINGFFKKGRDIVDSETKWTLPASFIPDEAIEKTKIALFIDPKEIKKENSIVTITPASIKIVQPFIQKTIGMGAIDKTTGMPIATDTNSLLLMSEKEKRFLNRNEKIGVRPILRNYSNNLDARYCINTRMLPDYEAHIFGKK